MLISFSDMKRSLLLNARSVGWIAVCLISLSASAATTVAVENEEYPLEPLRDPFWPVGYYPENWKAGHSASGDENLAVSDWDIPASMIRVNGASRMGDQTAAIINGQVKGIGDLVEIHYKGRIYQWKLTDVQPSGKVRLERFAVKNETSGVQKENKQ